MEFDDLNIKLRDLKPKVKKKALEIAEKLEKENGLSREEAVKKGIALAEEWFYNMGG